MEMAVEEAREGIANGDGGPFGAIVVKDGKVIASGHNRVLSSNNSTCHGEIDAIRMAARFIIEIDGKIKDRDSISLIILKTLIRRFDLSNY